MAPKKKLSPKRPPRRGALMGMRSGFRRAVGANAPGKKRVKPSIQRSIVLVLGGVALLALIFGLSTL